MDTLIIHETSETPELIFNPTDARFSITGKSLPEDAYEFYSKANEWMETYIDNANEQTIFDVRLKYLNSSSSKEIYNILAALEDIQDKGKKVKINWYYKNGDELMKDKGEEFNEFIEVPFELIVE